MLSRNGLIEMRKGYGHEDKTRAQRTKIWPTVKLLEAFEPIRVEDVVIEPVDLVTLHDEDKRPIDYRDTRETRRVREVLRKVNRLADEALVQYVDPKTHMAYRLRTRLYCVYNRDLKHGGRFYTANKDGYQGLSEEDRACIHIDGEPTVELDFSGIYPRILYAWEDIQYNEDPYGVVTDDAALREVIKRLFMMVVNSESEVEAVRAGNKFLYENRMYFQRLARRGLKVKDDLIPMIKEAHRPIAHYFFTGTGLKAMHSESQIALEVISHFANDGVPVLSVHDSFIVQRQHRYSLRRVMSHAYRKHTGDFRCPIK